MANPQYYQQSKGGRIIMTFYDNLTRKMNDKAYTICLDIKNRILKNALREIEDIANDLLLLTNEYHDCYYKDSCFFCRNKEQCQYKKVEQMLKIINKIKGEE